AHRLARRSAACWNMDGPTGTTLWSAIGPVELGEGAVRIGGPIANTQFYVLDRRGEPLPLGGVGELHIGGMGLSRGYLNRPELTAERFIPNPFAKIEDRGLKIEDS